MVHRYKRNTFFLLPSLTWSNEILTFSFQENNINISNQKLNQALLDLRPKSLSAELFRLFPKRKKWNHFANLFCSRSLVWFERLRYNFQLMITNNVFPANYHRMLYIIERWWIVIRRFLNDLPTDVKADHWNSSPHKTLIRECCQFLLNVFSSLLCPYITCAENTWSTEAMLTYKHLSFCEVICLWCSTHL